MRVIVIFNYIPIMVAYQAYWYIEHTALTCVTSSDILNLSVYVYIYIYIAHVVFNVQHT